MRPYHRWVADHLSAAVEALAGDLTGALIAVDFDGTLAPIVDDPTRAFAEPAAIDALARLGGRGAQIAIITGRPVEMVARLADIEGRRGFEQLVVCGQYGVERWDVAADRVSAPPPPQGLAALVDELPEVLAAADAGAARIEHKGHAVVVHTRELAEGAAVFDRLATPLARLAERHGLVAEPGRSVWEIRDASIDKGSAIRALLSEMSPAVVVYAGDDLGDVPAFAALETFRAEGGQAVLVCSASAEQDALVARSDAVVDGPLGVAIWLTEFAEDVGA